MGRVGKLIFLIIILIGLPVSLYLLGRATNFFGRAFGTPANLVIDTGTSFSPLPDVWRNLAQGGEETNRMLLPVVEKVKPLGLEYVRLDHIFDMYGVVSKPGGQINLNWTKLDETVNDILAMGAKPFFALSYMPPAISKTGNTTDLPINWADWEYIVQQTIQHYSGERAIPNVYYEVWNEPDLFGGFKTYGDKNYLDLYLHSSIAASRARGVLAFKFGGPATTALYESWVTNFVKFVENNNLRLDFYSWHKYTKEIDNIANNAVNARNWLASSLSHQNVELVITELGPNSENDKVYDGHFAAIHTIASAAVLQDEVSRAFNFEIKDGPGPSKEWGRWGIFTHEKYGEPSAKPRFSALAFLNRMNGNKVNVAGEGSWVKAFAKNDGRSLKTLVVNYDPQGTHSEAVPMTFVNLPLNMRNFTFRRTNYGSGAARDRPVATDSATWATLELMNPNSAAIFEIIPQ